MRNQWPDPFLWIHLEYLSHAGVKPVHACFPIFTALDERGSGGILQRK